MRKSWLLWWLVTGFSPWIRRIFPSGNIRFTGFSPGKFRSFGPYDIAIGSGPSASHSYYGSWMSPWVRDWGQVGPGCNLATHCSVFVRLGLGKTHLFSGVEGSIQSVTDAKGEGLGTSPRRAPTILNCRRMMAKQSLFSPAYSVLSQDAGSQDEAASYDIEQKFAKGSNYDLI